MAQPKKGSPRPRSLHLGPPGVPWIPCWARTSGDKWSPGSSCDPGDPWLRTALCGEVGRPDCWALGPVKMPWSPCSSKPGWSWTLGGPRSADLRVYLHRSAPSFSGWLRASMKCKDDRRIKERHGHPKQKSCVSVQECLGTFKVHVGIQPNTPASWTVDGQGLLYIGSPLLPKCCKRRTCPSRTRWVCLYVYIYIHMIGTCLQMNFNFIHWLVLRTVASEGAVGIRNVWWPRDPHQFFPPVSRSAKHRAIKFRTLVAKLWGSEIERTHHDNHDVCDRSRHLGIKLCLFRSLVCCMVFAWALVFKGKAQNSFYLQMPEQSSKLNDTHNHHNKTCNRELLATTTTTSHKPQPMPLWNTLHLPTSSSQDPPRPARWSPQHLRSRRVAETRSISAMSCSVRVMMPGGLGVRWDPAVPARHGEMKRFRLQYFLKRERERKTKGCFCKLSSGVWIEGS